MKTYLKQFATGEDAREERDGHAFFDAYYDRIPSLIMVDTDRASVIYEAVDPRYTTVSDALGSGETIDINGCFIALADMAGRTALTRTAAGGTRKFFVDRLGRLADLQEPYAAWSRANPKILVQDREIPVEPGMLSVVHGRVSRFSRGLCVPSQGDFHERNIFTDGTIIDFEAAGWNLVATDIATFIWHTLFVGDHFGPRYAKWASPDGLHTEAAPRGTLEVFGHGVCLKPSSARCDLVRRYLECYVDVVPLDDKAVSDIAAALCMRFLTTFPVLRMSVQDRQLSFALANYFLTGDPLEKMRALLV